jgi:excisionase family DNA binding protein
MNKQEACEYLGVSERSLARYAAQGKVQVTYTKGKRGNVALYDDADLERLKDELAQPTSIRPAIDSALPATSDTHAIAKVAGLGNVAAAGAIHDLLTVIADRLQPSERPAVPVENKLTLSLAEASALAGLSRGFLLSAIHDRKLKADKRGKGWNVKRADLDSYIKKL